MHFQDPLVIKAMMAYLRPDLQPGQELSMTPFLMAGWVGMLITGLNMLPISQLDGGHVLVRSVWHQCALASARAGCWWRSVSSCWPARRVGS